MTKFANRVHELKVDAMELARHDGEFLKSREAFDCVMWPDDETINRYRLTREQFNEALSQAYRHMHQGHQTQAESHRV